MKISVRNIIKIREHQIAGTWTVGAVRPSPSIKTARNGLEDVPKNKMSTRLANIYVNFLWRGGYLRVCI